MYGYLFNEYIYIYSFKKGDEQKGIPKSRKK